MPLRKAAYEEGEMDVIKIRAASYMSGGSPGQDLQDCAVKKILLEDDVPIFHFLDGAGFDGNSIHKVRVAREIPFGCKTFLKLKSTGEVLLRPGTLGEMIRSLDEGRLKDYRFVLDSDDKELLSEIIQQLLYLDIDIEVMLLNEEAEIRKMEAFSKIFPDLKLTLEDARARLYSVNVSGMMREQRNNVLYLLSGIETALTEMKENTLKVAIMALKKSGKSVVVNCLLGDDYTPASIELPTFTTCIYRKSRDNRISLNYKFNAFSFDSADALRKYMLTEFRNMQTGGKPEYSPHDMDISYIPGEYSSCDYTVIDTPGPDLAGSRHKEIAYKWIGEADVILFIIDYSKYLTSSEEEFFRDIKKVFEEHRKFYSFIIVVNKLDLMYLSDEKKSGIRFIDFLRARLKDLGYRGFIIFGISALQYFYSLKAVQLGGRGLDTDEGGEFRELLDRCLVEKQGKDDMTVFSFLDSQIRNMRWFHGKENATLKDLREKSGFEQLVRYINYISLEKAHVELFNHKMHVIDGKLTELRDEFIDKLLVGLESDSGRLEGMTEGLVRFGDEIADDVKNCFVLEDIMHRIENDMGLARKSLYKIIRMQVENIIERLVRLFKSFSNSELLSFQKGDFHAVDDIFHVVEKNVIEKLYSPVLGKYCGSVNREFVGKNERLQECKKMIQEKVSELNEYLDRDFAMENSDAALPRLPDSFTGFDFGPVIMKLDTVFAETLIRERLARKRGLFGALLLVFSFGLINIRTGRLTFDDIKLKKALFIVRRNLEESIQKQVDEMHGKLSLHMRASLDAFTKLLLETEQKFGSDYKAVFHNFMKELGTLKGELEFKRIFLKEARTGVERFRSVWDRIKEPD